VILHPGHPRAKVVVDFCDVEQRGEVSMEDFCNILLQAQEDQQAAVRGAQRR
jgi:hypothetical protein